MLFSHNPDPDPLYPHAPIAQDLREVRTALEKVLPPNSVEEVMLQVAKGAQFTRESVLNVLSFDEETFNSYKAKSDYVDRIKTSDIVQAELVLEAGIRPDRKNAQIECVFKICHHYQGLESQKHINNVPSVLGYLIVYASSYNEKLAEVYKVPNPSIRSAELFSRMVQTVIPTWFGEVTLPLHNDDEPGDSGGTHVFSPIKPTPPVKNPGHENCFPNISSLDSTLTIVGGELPLVLSR